MKLSRKDYEFNNTRICHIMPKHIELDRVLINLYMLLKYDGRRPVARTGRTEVTVDYIVSQLEQQHGDTLRGFRDYPEVVRDWVYSDLVDVVYRGIPEKETIAAPLPLHLNAYKLRNPKQAQDYRGAEHLYSMIRAGDPGLARRLAEFLGQGMGESGDTYDGETPLDLDTLVIVRMVDNPHLRENPSSSSSPPEPPLCKGQARLLCNDLRRLLAYKDVVPRSVLIGYLRTACGLHLGLYLMRLFHQLTGWVRDQEAHPACLNCPVHPDQSEHPLALCPYAFQNTTADYLALPELLIDMGEDYTTHMAKLSRENCTRHYAAINDYIHSVLTINQLKRFAESDRGRRSLSPLPEAVSDLVALLRRAPDSLQDFFSYRLDEILPQDELVDERPEIKAVYAMRDLSSLERFIELVALERTRYYRKYLTEQVDAVLMKNQDTGLLRQGKGKRNERRWHIGSRLLEMLVQIAVLEPTGSLAGTGFSSRPILIDQFVAWLRARYGLVLMPDWPDATIEDYKAFNTNLQHLKARLREIGFYTDLSDAYNTQTIRPRYTIQAVETGA
jgi:hypothetical protein